MNRSTNKKYINALRLFIIGFVCLLSIYPLIFLLANSLRQYISREPLLFFSQFHWENYKMAVTMVPFLKMTFNSVILVVISVGLSLVFDFLFGYAFARLKAPGKNAVFSLVILQLMIPGIAIQVPQYVFFSQIHLTNTYWIWVLGGIGGNAFNIFLVKQFLSVFPHEIEEAAKIDGCSVIGIIWRIVLPLSKPIIGLLLFNQFCGTWNDYMGPYMYLNSDKLPLATALFNNLYYLPSKPDITLDPIVFAACVLFSIPVIILFFCLQRFLVEGIVTTGLKI